MTARRAAPMKPWVADVVAHCHVCGPQTSHELAAFVLRRTNEFAASPSQRGSNAYAGTSLAPNEILLRLRARRDLVVEVVGTRRVEHPNGSTRLRDTYMVRLREPADDVRETT